MNTDHVNTLGLGYCQHTVMSGPHGPLFGPLPLLLLLLLGPGPLNSNQTVSRHRHGKHVEGSFYKHVIILFFIYKFSGLPQTLLLHFGVF